MNAIYEIQFPSKLMVVDLDMEPGSLLCVGASESNTRVSWRIISTIAVLLIIVAFLIISKGELSSR
jgi:hypothetical protein